MYVLRIDVQKNDCAQNVCVHVQSILFAFCGQWFVIFESKMAVSETLTWTSSTTLHVHPPTLTNAFDWDTLPKERFWAISQELLVFV